MKKILISIICCTFLFTITGCESKKSIAATDFKIKVENEGYIIQDMTSNYANYGYKNVLIALSKDATYQIEYYELKDEKSAKDFFKQKKVFFEQNKSSKVTNNKTISKKNYDKYSFDDKEKYKMVERIDNTVVYLNVADDSKKEVEKTLKKLGY